MVLPANDARGFDSSSTISPLLFLIATCPGVNSVRLSLLRKGKCEVASFFKWVVTLISSIAPGCPVIAQSIPSHSSFADIVSNLLKFCAPPWAVIVSASRSFIVFDFNFGDKVILKVGCVVAELGLGGRSGW